MDEKAQKEALKELNKSLEVDRKKRKRIILSLLVVYLFLVIVYQTIIGVLPGENPDFLGFKIIPIKDIQTKEKYEISINNYDKLDYYIQKDFKFPIIPFLVDMIDYDSDSLGDGEPIVIKSNNGFKIKYKVYNCYSDYAGKLVNEKCDSHIVKYEEIDIKHKLKIIKEEFPKDEILYDGKYIEDISYYLKDKGEYKIVLYYKKKFITTKVQVYVSVNDDEEN